MQELLTHDNLVKIHYLMIYQLEELRKMAEDYLQFLNVSETEYLKHELVLDSLGLMESQSEEMRR